MQEAITFAESNYDLKDAKLEKLAEMAHEMTCNRLHSTIGRTGPYVVKKLFSMSEEEKRPIGEGGLLLTKHAENKEVCLIKSIKPRADRLLTVPTPEGDYLDWLQVPYRRRASEKAVADMTAMILFEAERFRFFRPEYYINLLVKEQKMKPEEATAKVLATVDKLSYPLSYVQYSFKWSAVIEFCKQKQLKTLFDLNAPTLQKIVEIEMCLDDVCRMCGDLEEEIEGQAGYFSNYAEHIKRRPCQEVVNGIQFLSHLIPALKQFQPAKLKLIRKELLNYINHYKMFIANLKQADNGLYQAYAFKGKIAPLKQALRVKKTSRGSKFKK